VRDASTGLPIPAARVRVLDLDPVLTDAAGGFRTSGSRADQCNLDYYYSITVTAPGYESYSLDLYTNALFPTLEVELQPVGAAAVFTVSGFVAEFPECDGRMRGVTVSLQPLGLSVQTSLDGGEFSFTDVPPGDYVLSVDGCNPFGCWRDTSIRVAGADVETRICMVAPTPRPTPTPTFSPTACVQPTAPLCAVGEKPRCGADACVAGCDCAPCDACPDGEVYSGERNRCDCVPCPVATPCPSGQRRLPCDAPCGLGCGCEDSPGDSATRTTTSSGGCAVTRPHDPWPELPLLWALGLLALCRRARRSSVDRGG
jgi:hypothetical protein